MDIRQDVRRMNSTSVIITYLELREAVELDPEPLPEGVSIRRVSDPPPEQYRRLYNDVGRSWHWTDRATLSDDEIKRLVHRHDVDVYLLEVGAAPAGFCELRGGTDRDVEIVYFGLVPSFIGRGLARPFLRFIINEAIRRAPRVWLHTCSLDHPTALPLYRTFGFMSFKTEARTQPLRPDAGFGTMPRPDP